MRGQRILIAGCGDIGSALGLRLLEAGCRVSGLRRRAELLPAVIEPLAVDLTDREALRCKLVGSYDCVVVSSAAGQYDVESYRRTYVEGLRNLLDTLAPTVRVLLVSSTGVYHQKHGEWVDEDSATEPGSFSGQLLLEAEQLLRQRRGAAACIVRFGGIYGPGRERLLEEVQGGIGCPRTPVRYANRIHREDCVGILDFLLQRMCRTGAQGYQPLYLGVDCEPAPQWEVRHWLAERLGVTLEDGVRNTGMRDPGSKRCSNRRLLQTGYRFRYADYRSGYAMMLAATPP